MKHSNDKNLGTDNYIKETETVAEARPVRTFIDDIARLKKGNKLTQKDISQIAPNIIDKVRRLDEIADKKENSDKFYQEVMEQEANKFANNINKNTQEEERAPELEMSNLDKEKGEEKREYKKLTMDISSLSPQTKAETNTKINRLEEITRNIESKYFSEEAERSKPIPTPQQETEEVKKIEDKPEIKRDATPDEKIEAEKANLKETALAIQKEKNDLETRITETEEEKGRIKIENKSRKELEVEIENQENELRKQKNEAENAKTRQELEKKRQSKEDERQRIELERWNTDKHIADLEKRIEDIKKQELVLTEKEALNETEIQKLEKKQLTIRAKTEKSEVIKKLVDMKKMRTELETEWKDISNSIRTAQDEEASISKRKNIIEAEIQTLETQEHKIVDPTEIHKTEEARWKKDKEFRGLEEASLTAEEKKSSLEESLIKIETKSREVIHTEQEILDKMAEIDRIISASEQDTENAKQS